MIKLEDSEITQILPVNLKYDKRVQAISYAIKNTLNKAMQYSNLISVYAAIDNLPEQILDLIAVESRTQYYDESLSIDTKREILKNTLLWYYKAGTPSAVEELIATVFGEGEVQEWFLYGGQPYYFRILSNGTLEQGSAVEFNKMIRKVKNARSHLDSLEFSRTIEQNLYASVSVISETHAYIDAEV